MSAPSAVLGSTTTGHGCWPPTTICKASKNVISENMPAAYISCNAIPHTCTKDPYPTHGLVIASGSSSVIINGFSASRIGDSMSCGDVIAMGKQTIIIGG